MSEPAIDIRRMTPDEKLRLLEQLWDSLSDDDVQLTDVQKSELDRRLDELDREGPKGAPFDEALDQLRS